MLRFKEGEYARDLLYAIAFSGEFPYHSLSLIDGNERIIKRVLLKMKKEGYITISGNGVMKTIRLTKKGLKPLSLLGENFVAHYKKVTDNQHFSSRNTEDGGRKIWRAHRLSEVLLLFRKLNVPIFDFEKPSLQTGEKVILSEDVFFYSSTEIKNFQTNQRLKVDFTRILGILFSPENIYCVYNTNKGLMKWHTQGEHKAKMLVSSVASANYQSEKPVKVESCILFAKSMDVGLLLLENTKKRKDAIGFDFLSFDNTFENIHLVPISSFGLVVLYILMQRNYQKRIFYHIFEQSPSLEFEKDQMVINDTFYFLFVDGNLGGIRRLKYKMDFLKKKVVVICFSYQKEFVEKYLGEKVSIAIVKEEQVLKFF